MIAVRESSVSRYHGGLIESSPETPRIPQHHRIEGIKFSPYVVDRKEGFLNIRFVNEGDVDTTGFSCYITATLYNFTDINKKTSYI